MNTDQLNLQLNLQLNPKSDSHNFTTQNKNQDITTHHITSHHNTSQHITGQTAQRALRRCTAQVARNSRAQLHAQ
jgi:hypothetical protein